MEVRATMSDDLLATIDAALDDHAATVDQIGAELFAEAMDSVRDLIDGDVSEPYDETEATWVPPERKPEPVAPKPCDCPLCTGSLSGYWSRWAYPMEAVIAQQRAAERREADRISTLALLGVEVPSPRPVVMGASPDFVIVDETAAWLAGGGRSGEAARALDRFAIDVPFAGETLESMGIELPPGARITYETTPILRHRGVTAAPAEPARPLSLDDLFAPGVTAQAYDPEARLTPPS